MNKEKTPSEPVRLRERTLANGSRSLYLDIYRNGRRSKEYLKLYLVPETCRADVKQNRETLATAQAIKAKRVIEIQNHAYTFTKQYKEDTLFLPYFRNMCEERFHTDSQSNWGNWHSCLRHLERYCDEHTTFKEIDKDWILGFKSYLEVAEKDSHKKSNGLSSKFYQPLSQNSKQSYFNKLRCCIKDAYENHIIPDNPLRGVKGFENAEVERPYLTVEEVKMLAATDCKYPWLKNAFLFSCLTGLRKSDIESLTWGDVQQFGDYTRIVFKQKKTKGQEYLDITDQALEYMGPRGSSDKRVFAGFKYGAWTLLELRRWAMAAGITKDFTFHCGRHTFAVMMLALGTDIYTVSKLLGHRNISTTQIYAKVIDKSKQDAINRIPSIK